ncbi:hypothetical protein LT493_43535 [Streptomyces tricolor]|nr:hypothetical protein [Streptomyces tricolor]
MLSTALAAADAGAEVPGRRGRLRRRGRRLPPQGATDHGAVPAAGPGHHHRRPARRGRAVTGVPLKHQRIGRILATEIRTGGHPAGGGAARRARPRRAVRLSAVRRSRAALAELTEQGLITTRRTGKGSYVVFDGRPPDDRPGRARALALRDVDSTVRTLAVREIRDSALAAGLGLEKDAFVCVERTRERVPDGTVLSYERTFLPPVPGVRELPARGLGQEPLAEVLRRAGLRPDHGGAAGVRTPHRRPGGRAAAPRAGRLVPRRAPHQPGRRRLLRGARRQPARPRPLRADRRLRVSAARAERDARPPRRRASPGQARPHPGTDPAPRRVPRRAPGHRRPRPPVPARRARSPRHLGQPTGDPVARLRDSVHRVDAPMDEAAASAPRNRGASARGHAQRAGRARGMTMPGADRFPTAAVLIGSPTGRPPDPHACPAPHRVREAGARRAPACPERPYDRPLPGDQPWRHPHTRACRRRPSRHWTRWP